MNLSLVFAYLQAILREISARKLLYICLGALIALSILLVGTRHQAGFETSMVINADNQSILRPLLASQAEVSRVQEHTRVVRESMLSPSLLKKTVAQVYPQLTDPLDIETRVKQIRSNLAIIGLGDGHIRITISGDSRDEIYDTINALTDLFIKDSSETQKSESRSAFDFIDNQVRQYKSQLVEAEENLKLFRSGSLEGSVEEIAQRISQLQSTIETMRLDVDDASTRLTTLRRQLDSESRLSSKTYKSDIYRQRLSELTTQRDTLLLQYHESYPDVVNLTLQINDMKKAIAEAHADDANNQNSAVSEIYSPLYEKLRAQLSSAEIDYQAKKKRLAANELLLERELSRRTTVAAGEAELAELNRDYNVTKKIYEDMLERKEKARLSMTLSAEGQGVSYKIVEPPVYPLYPKGIRFIHFAILGLFFGVAIPVGGIVAYVLLDPRIRFLYQLESAVNLPLLAVLPRVNSSITKRLGRSDTLMAIIALLFFFILYLCIILGHRSGFFERLLSGGGPL